MTDFYLHTGNENEENSKCQLNLHVYIHSWNTRKSEFSGKYNNSKFRNTPKARKRVTVKDTFSQISAAIKNAEHSEKKSYGTIKLHRTNWDLLCKKKKPRYKFSTAYRSTILWYAVMVHISFSWKWNISTYFRALFMLTKYFHDSRSDNFECQKENM